MAVEPANLIELINSNLQPTGQLGSDTKRGVSYRQCGNIQKRGATEAICLHENERPLEAICLQ